MSISFTNYVDITSGVSGGGAVRERELILRLFSSSNFIPANSFAEFESADDVGAYFGTTSAEYLRAVFYFSFVSKRISSPQKISIASFVAAAQAPYVLGDPANTDTLAQLVAMTTGTINLTLGATTHTLTGVSFAGAGSLAAVAADLQTAVRAGVPGDPVWAGAAVSYTANGPNGGYFELLGGASTVPGQGSIAITPISGEDIGAALGWESAAAIVSQASTAQTLTQTLANSAGASNNFATFSFIPTLNPTQHLEVATWNASQNVDYMYLAPVAANTAAAISAELLSLPAVGMTLSPIATEFPELIPGCILAATDYDNSNASQNYMYQQFGNITPSVTDDLHQSTYDPLRINYYGQTQTNGQQVSFYQRGNLTGGSTSPTDMNVYANEIWFKGDVANGWFNALLTLVEIPTSPSGRATGISILEDSAQRAINNGTISVPQTLTNLQKAAIAQQSGSAVAYQQIAAIGYWCDVDFASTITEDGITEYQAVYTFIYAKNNAIRKVVGTHSLI